MHAPLAALYGVAGTLRAARCRACAACTAGCVAAASVCMHALQAAGSISTCPSPRAACRRSPTTSCPCRATRCTWSGPARPSARSLSRGSRPRRWAPRAGAHTRARGECPHAFVFAREIACNMARKNVVLPCHARERQPNKHTNAHTSRCGSTSRHTGFSHTRSLWVCGRRRNCVRTGCDDIAHTHATHTQFRSTPAHDGR